MKIACVIFGTRGDVQPMIALACGLMERGHEVIVCAPPEHSDLAKRHNCRFEPFGPDVQKYLSENPEKQKSGTVINISPKDGKKIFLDQINLLPAVIKGVDLVLGAGIVMGVQTAAEILKVPYRLVAFYPVILGTTKDDPIKFRLLFAVGRRLLNIIMKGYINKARASYNLPPVKGIWEHWLGESVILACDKEINAGRKNTEFAFTQTGFMLLPSKSPLPGNVEDFLNSGKTPVYIGFGSNPIPKVEKYTSLFEHVRDTTGQRLIISKGWAGFPATEAKDILYVDELPFDLLFPRVAAAVYHGGTGTLAAVARAGIPQAVFPFMGDQFDNRKQVVKLGLGPACCDFKKISAASISEAIIKCMKTEEYKNNATVLANKLRNVNGVELTVMCVEEVFNELE
jgi:vancomycin aglycone glucosyltransferase